MVAALQALTLAHKNFDKILKKFPPYLIAHYQFAAFNSDSSSQTDIRFISAFGSTPSTRLLGGGGGIEETYFTKT